jgi:hypothetical protein
MTTPRPTTPAARIKRAFATIEKYYDEESGPALLEVQACCRSCSTSNIDDTVPTVILWEADGKLNSKRGWYRRPAEDTPFVGYLGYLNLSEHDMDSVVNALESVGLEVVRPADANTAIKVTMYRNTELRQAYLRGLRDALETFSDLGVEDAYATTIAVENGIKA